MEVLTNDAGDETVGNAGEVDERQEEFNRYVHAHDVQHTAQLFMASLLHVFVGIEG